MAYTQLTTSPATVQFARSMGATGFHIGILGALPLGLVCMQLLSAVAVQRLARRKPLWMVVVDRAAADLFAGRAGALAVSAGRRADLDLDALGPDGREPRPAALCHAAVAVVDG